MILRIHSFVSLLAILALIASASSGSLARLSRADDNDRGEDVTPWVTLFDGKSLHGWNVRKGEEQFWSTNEGLIQGGSLESMTPFNTFLSTDIEFSDFELIVEIKIEGTKGFVNSGIQIRSQRDPNSHEMIGYQCDIGQGWWGKIYDETRRNKVVGELVDADRLQAAVKVDDWNVYRIVAKGRNIKTFLNDVPGADFVEADSDIPQVGKIALQVHGDGITRILVRSIKLRVLDSKVDP
jgi:hypothetical protein